MCRSDNDWTEFQIAFQINSLHQMNGVDCLIVSITASNLGSFIE